MLKDETQLFALLDGLADDKKNLLTYLFDKHGARATGGGGCGYCQVPEGDKEVGYEDEYADEGVRFAQSEPRRLTC